MTTQTSINLLQTCSIFRPLTRDILWKSREKVPISKWSKDKTNQDKKRPNQALMLLANRWYSGKTKNLPQLKESKLSHLKGPILCSRTNKLSLALLVIKLQFMLRSQQMIKCAQTLMLVSPWATSKFLDIVTAIWLPTMYKITVRSTLSWLQNQVLTKTKLTLHQENLWFLNRMPLVNQVTVQSNNLKPSSIKLLMYLMPIKKKPNERVSSKTIGLILEPESQKLNQRSFDIWTQSRSRVSQPKYSWTWLRNYKRGEKIISKTWTNLVISPN